MELHSLCVYCLLKKEATKGGLDQESRNLGLATLPFPVSGTPDHSCGIIKCQPWAKCQIWLSAGTKRHKNEPEPQGAYHLNTSLKDFQRNLSIDL